ncbi:hypothetical protein ABDI30_17550 [Paenibacillus cisolokensis]|uniref:hypothetical protein n=1 Tax=Paenibacillus cisolokensis TaxID=1658519 RepID=UPI003D2C2F3A
MKAVPKVNTDGLYMEDALVDDAFSGVVPFYAEPPVPDPEQSADPKDEPQEEQKPEIAGYIVGVPVPPGLYLPRFDLAAWETYQDELQAAEMAYREAREAWLALPEDERGEPPAYVPTEMPTLWIEGMTPEEIEEITTPQPQEPTETERLAAEVAELKELSAQNQSDIQAVESNVEKAQEDNAELRETSSVLGSEQAKQELTVIDLRQQNNVIGGELVKKEISIMDLHMQNQVLGQMLAALELKLLANGTGGEPDVQQ